FKAYKEGKVGKATVQLERKALTIDSTTTGNAGVGQMIVPQRLPGLITPAQNQVHMRDLILSGSMQNNSIQYLEEKWFFPVATEITAGVAAAATTIPIASTTVGFFVGQDIFITNGTVIEKRRITALTATQITVAALTNAYAAGSVVGSYQITGTAPTTQKPQGVWKTDLKTENEKTIAFFFKIAKQTLDDVPQLLSMIDARALDGLLNAEDWQLLFGDGLGQNLNGLFTRASLYNRTQAGDTRIDVLRRATTQLRLQEAYATMAVLAPEDWESIELQKGTDARYLWVDVSDGGVPRLWRMPIVDTTLMPAGSWMIGDGNQAQIFDRQSATIELFEQDVDNVQKNLITVRVEERLALANYRPTSFVKGNSWS
ncbi:MAG: phage major capsid protein, partial [Shewanella sp.]